MIFACFSYVTAFGHVQYHDIYNFSDYYDIHQNIDAFSIDWPYPTLHLYK